MEISQEPKFQPITIILESKEEAEALWKAVRFFDFIWGEINEKDVKILGRINNWFSTQANLYEKE